MRSRKSRPPELAGLTWLSEVRRVVTPVTPQHPVWVQSMVIPSGAAASPESHSNCELCFIDERRIRPPLKWRDWCQSRCHELNEEFTTRSFGWEAKLRTLLLEIILDFMRWEQANGRPIPQGPVEVDWTPIERALRYLREHVSEPVYGRDLAAAAGIGESRLKVLFREVVGTTWSQFLQGYRIHLVAARLCEPGRNIMEVASSVGFENQSHFSATFHSLMGVSPREYARRVVGQRK